MAITSQPDDYDRRRFVNEYTASIVQPLAHCEFFSFWTRSGRWWDWPARDVVTLAAVQLPLTRSGANVAYWHFGDIARSQIDFRFPWKSGRAADITAITEFDPNRQSDLGVATPNWGMRYDGANCLIQNDSDPSIGPAGRSMAG